MTQRTAAMDLESTIDLSLAFQTILKETEDGHVPSRITELPAAANQRATFGQLCTLEPENNPMDDGTSGMQYVSIPHKERYKDLT
jgi:hypothetical protein